MGAAWVGPLRTGTSGLGDTAAFNPRGRRSGPGGEQRLPDCRIRAYGNVGICSVMCYFLVMPSRS